jgi:hypothetical protein
VNAAVLNQVQNFLLWDYFAVCALKGVVRGRSTWDETHVGEFRRICFGEPCELVVLPRVPCFQLFYSYACVMSVG